MTRRRLPIGIQSCQRLAPEGAAMAQLKRRRYADKSRGLGRPIHLIGVEFSRETRNIAAFEVERA